jgi:hypothetical protein
VGIEKMGMGSLVSFSKGFNSLIFKKLNILKMDNQNRKLDLIKSLILIEDEESIDFLEAYLKAKPYRLTKSELLNRADLASENIVSGKYQDQDDLEKGLENWH